MRPILHVISGLRTGGAETMLVALCRALMARGLPQQVVTLTPDGPNQPILEGLGVTVTVIDPRRPLGAVVAVARLVRHIRATHPALVQGWLYHGDLLAALVHRLAGRPSDTRLAWNLRNSDIDDARYGRLLGIARRLSTWPDLVVSNSQAGLDFHLSRGYRPRLSAVIPNGIDVERFRPDPAARSAMRAALGIDEATIVALHAARLDPMKDHATLVAAAARLPAIRFLLIGEGTQTLQLPLSATAFGRRDDPETFAAASDIVVSSSAFGEGFSNALAEGMAAGAVPVATDVGDAATVMGDRGRLVRPGDPAALAEAIAGLAADPAGLREEGLAARARIAAKFGHDAMAERFLAAWRECGARLED